MRKGLENQDAYDLETIKEKLSTIDSFSNITLRVYKDENPKKFYFVEAAVYVDDKVYESMDGVRGDGETDVAVYLWAQDQVKHKLRFSKKNVKVERVVVKDFNN